MSGQDRVRWDTIYRDRLTTPPDPDPDPLLFQFAPPLRDPGTATALDLACGLGQNGLWLAEQGYVVSLIDVSRVALTHVQAEAVRRNLRHVNFFQLDLDNAELEADAYDLVCVFRFLSRDLFPQIRAAVKPGGRILYQTFNTRYLATRPDMPSDYLLNIGELAGLFGDWRILRLSEPEEVSQLVAIKPEK
jgi:SAM-dependent methyltransferase